MLYCPPHPLGLPSRAHTLLTQVHSGFQLLYSNCTLYMHAENSKNSKQQHTIYNSAAAVTAVALLLIRLLLALRRAAQVAHVASHAQLQ